MTTLVGTQDDFSDALKSLIELDYDAIEAYKTAIDKLESTEYITNLKRFMQDHQRHISELSPLLTSRNIEAPAEASMKQWLTKGKVVLANLMGDKKILSAMLSNENDTNAAYEKMNSRNDIWADAVEPLKKGFEDEKRHKAWLLAQDL